MAAITSVLTHQSPDLDATLCVWLLRRFGQERYPGIAQLPITFCPAGELPGGESPEALEEQGILTVDTGGGRLDTHARDGKSDPAKAGKAAASLVAADLGVQDRPDLAKMLEFVSLAESQGKSISSSNPLDHLVSLPNVIRGLNALHPEEPGRVVELMMELWDAIHLTEHDWILAERDFAQAQVKVLGGGARLAAVTSDSTGILKVARHYKCDLIVHRTSAGQVGITCRNHGALARLELTRLAAILRVAESVRGGVDFDPDQLGDPGMNHGWYLHDSRRILSKGSAKNRQVPPTRLDLGEILEWAAASLEGASPPPASFCALRSGEPSPCQSCAFGPFELSSCVRLREPVPRKVARSS